MRRELRGATPGKRESFAFLSIVTRDESWRININFSRSTTSMTIGPITAFH